MTRRSRLPLLLIAAVVVVGTAGCGHGGSDATADGTSISIQYPMVDQPANPEVTAVRMVVHNPTDRADTLIGVSSPIAKVAAIHRSEVDSEGRSTMVEQKELPIAARSDVYFEPSGLHVMLTGLDRKLALGDEVPLTLTFRRAGKIGVMATVVAPGTVPEADHER